MFFRVTRVTDDVFCLESGEESSFQTVFVNSNEMSLLQEALRDAESLLVAESSERWYNS